MANQPKKYTKFVAAAATATLVASAIVPVASAAGFSDVADTNSHAVNINALAEAGIIGGYPDGTFKPNQELTRGQVVKMLGKWVEAQGFEIPADYATKARFTDLAADAKDQELVKYAALVFDTGVFAGSNGALNAGGKITRENMALVLDRAFKAINDTTLVEVAAEIEDVKVADLATAKAEAREAIQALRNLGISGVENFMPKNSVTRAQFATFLNKTINTDSVVELTVKEAVAVDANTVEVTLSDDTKHTVKLEKALEANKATEIKFTIDEKEFTAEVTYVLEVKSAVALDANTVEVVLSDDTKHTIELEDDLVPNKSTEITFKINEVEFKSTVTFVVKELAASVKALDAKTIEVTFTQEMEDIDASDIEVIKAGGSNSIVTDVELQKDKKTAIVTLSESMVNNTGYDVKVKNTVESVYGDTFKEGFVHTFQFNDTVAPAVTAVTVNEKGELVVKFSEAIKASTAVFSLNGATAVGTQDSTDASKFTVAVPSTVKKGDTIDVIVSGATDIASSVNTMKIYTTTVKYDFAVNAPQVTELVAANEAQIKLTFSKEVTTPVVDTNVKVFLAGVALVPTTDFTVSAVTADTTGTKYEINFTTAGLAKLYANNANEASVKVTVEKYTDTLTPANMGAKVEQNVTVKKDTAKPAVKGSVVYKASTATITAKLTKKVAATTALESSMYILDTKTGVKHSVVAGAAQDGKLSVAQLAANADEIVINNGTTANKALTNGTYQLVIEANALTDGAYATNKNDKIVTTFTVTDSTNQDKPAVTSVGYGADNNTLTVSFDLAVDVTATNASNYKIAGKSLPNGSVITLDATKKVATIVLPEGSFATSGNQVVTVENIKSVDGITMDAFEQVLAVKDNTKVKLTAATLVEGAIVLTFNENVDAATLDTDFANTDFIVTLNGTDLSSSTLTVGDITADAKLAKNQLKLTTTSVNFATAQSLTVELADAAAAEDAEGNKVVTGKATQITVK